MGASHLYPDVSARILQICMDMTVTEDDKQMDMLVVAGLRLIDVSVALDHRKAIKIDFHRSLAAAEFGSLLLRSPTAAGEAIDRGAFSDMKTDVQKRWRERARRWQNRRAA